MKNFIKNNWALIAVLILAFVFRFWQIRHLPGGLFPDEAANGLDINLMREGQIQPFYPRGNGREALFFYFEALSSLIFGRGVWQFHIVSAAFGFASVVAVYFLAKRMFGKRVALLSSFFLAVSSYAVTVSRTAFRANTVPLISTLTLFFIIKFFQAKDHKTKYQSAALAGLFFGLGFYTYTSFRMMVPLLFGFAVLLAIGFRQQIWKHFREYAKYKAVFAAVFLITISWLVSYYIEHPKDLVGRSGQVSVFSTDLNHGDTWGTFLEVTKKTAMSFFTDGDTNWRHNVSGFPFLTPLISVFFLLALILFSWSMLVFIKQAFDRRIQGKTAYQGLIATWFLFMLVPEITTAEGIPHGLRLTGMIPPLFILAGYGFNWVWERLPQSPKLFWEKLSVAAIFILAVVVYNFTLYFGITAYSPENYYAFRSDLTTVSNYLNERNQKAKTFLSLDEFSVQTVEYLTTDTHQPYQLVDPAHTYEVKLQRGDQVIFTQSTIFDRTKFVDYHKSAKLIREDFNQFHQLIMLVYEQP